MSTATGVRARARAELVREIKDAARRQLAAEGGAAGLSLRAVARELGMVSSALYRYFPSRDDLLTALIVDAYDAIGEAAELADAPLARDDLRGRWRAVCNAVRSWAGAVPHEYALVYGSPVPGYRAPEATVAHAARVAFVLGAILRDHADDVPNAPRQRGAVLPDDLLPGVPGWVMERGVIAWTQLFGLVSFELFGHLVGTVDDGDAFFARSVELMGDFVGLK